MNSPFDWIDQSLKDLEQRQLSRCLVNRSGPQSTIVELDGRRYGNFGSNDYLGLANHPRICEAVKDLVELEGVGSGASPLILGHTDLHRQLERDLASFEQTEAALVFSSGYAANIGTICGLVGASDAIYSDAKNHASIIDGCRLSRAAVHVYPHRDVQGLTQLMQMRKTSSRRRLIVTDGLFSMDGDLAPLEELADVAERYDAMLMVDEAHATGVLGQTGRGSCERAGICDRPCLIRTGTLSKSLGSLGGFVVADTRTVHWIVNSARTYIYSTALPATVCEAARVALQILRTEPTRRERVYSISDRLRAALAEHGLGGPSECGPIVPILIGDVARAVRMSSALRDQGIFVPVIRPPSVPKSESLLRASLSADHSDEMLDQLVSALIETAEK